MPHYLTARVTVTMNHIMGIRYLAWKSIWSFCISYTLEISQNRSQTAKICVKPKWRYRVKMEVQGAVRVTFLVTYYPTTRVTVTIKHNMGTIYVT